MQEKACVLCDAAAPGDTLWVIAFTFDRREVAEALAAAHRKGAQVLLILDRKQTLQGPAEQQRVALQASSLGVPVKLASGSPLSTEYERAGRGRMLSGILGICHTKGLLLWRPVGKEYSLELLTGSANFTTSSRANQEWAFRLLLAPGSPQLEAVGQWATALEQGSITLDAARLQSARSVRARSASPGN